MNLNSMAIGKRPDYIQHGPATNVAISLKRNLAMPIKNPGELGGLGGEFVVGPGLECSYAHRMRNTRDHAELGDILKAIGITVPQLERKKQPQRASGEKPGERGLENSPKRNAIPRRPSSKEGRIIVKIVDNPNLHDSRFVEA